MSCTPETYTFYPSQRRINYRFNKNDSIHVIFPYASFTLIGSGDVTIDNDHEQANYIERESNEYLLKSLKEKYKSDQLVIEYDRDSLKAQFGKMISHFLLHQRKELFIIRQF